MRFKIKRVDGEISKYDTFEVKVRPHMSVLEALFQIQDEQDGSLAFRYSCRGAVCGSCAILINKKQRLACRTQVDEIMGERVLSITNLGPVARGLVKTGEEILIEPLPGFPVIRDLIVDLDPFLKHYEEIKPWFDAPEGLDHEMLMSEKDFNKVDRYVTCILCGACYGACPSFGRDTNFIGPAALAKAWRFYVDSRNSNIDVILERVDQENGVWACDEVYRCVEVCPKDVPPTNAITGFMRKIMVHRLKRIFR